MLQQCANIIFTLDPIEGTKYGMQHDTVKYTAASGETSEFLVYTNYRNDIFVLVEEWNRNSTNFYWM